MNGNEFERGYQEVLDRIEEIINNQLDEYNGKLKLMNELLQNVLKDCKTEKEKIDQLLDETSNDVVYLNGMYKIKHILMCSSESVIARTLDRDFEAGRRAALDIIETVILSSKKGLDEIENELKKEELKKRITGAEFLHEQIKEKLSKQISIQKKAC